MGLKIMEHRANLIGGVLTIQSARGKGTSITCTVPPERGGDQ
jgi:signal transduction histidine kinase